jgi:tetratricopeptide (TPR) repeat protein
LSLQFLEESIEMKRLEEEGMFKISIQIVLFTLLYNLGVRLAEQNRLAEAIECFNQAIVLNPQQPSAYNNRAQAYQLQSRTDGKSLVISSFPDSFISILLEAMADLSTAIDLASNGDNHQKILSLALTQRGILNRFLGKMRYTFFS